MPFQSDREALRHLVDAIAQSEDPNTRAALDAVCVHLLSPDPALARLRNALAEMTSHTMPAADAPCHLGIVPQSRCRHCQRIATAHAILQETAQ